jgi:hypothetical protein
MPSTWVAPRVWVAGERVGASKMNEISTALGILYPYTAGGDMVYRDPAGDYLTRLAKPTVDSFLKNTSAGVPSYVALSSITGGIHAKAYTAYTAADQEITSTTYTDVTSATVNIVTTRTCTILMLATGTMGCDWATHLPYARCSIGGTVPANDYGSAIVDNRYGSGTFPYLTMLYKASAAAGTITCKIQVKIGTTGGTIYNTQGTIIVLAFAE